MYIRFADITNIVCIYSESAKSLVSVLVQTWNVNKKNYSWSQFSSILKELLQCYMVSFLIHRISSVMRQWLFKNKLFRKFLEFYSFFYLKEIQFNFNLLIKKYLSYDYQWNYFYLLAMVFLHNIWNLFYKNKVLKIFCSHFLFNFYFFP